MGRPTGQAALTGLMNILRSIVAIVLLAAFSAFVVYMLGKLDLEETSGSGSCGCTPASRRWCSPLSAGCSGAR
jgi:hypothetical protein